MWQMRARAAGLVALVIVTSMAAADSSRADDHQAGQADASFEAGRYLVSFHDVAPATTGSWHGAAVLARHADIGAWVVQANSASLAEIRADPLVRAVELDAPIRMTGVPDDPKWLQQWGPAAIQAVDAWDVSPGEATIRVAVIDTGIDADHPDGPEHLVLGPDYGDGDSNPDDANGHGTWTAGIIAAARNNALGVAGLANVEIYVIKVFGNDGSGFVSDLERGLLRAIQSDVNIISMSLGFDTYSDVIASRVQQAEDAGMLLVAGAGNENGGAVLYPAAYPGVIAVTSVDETLTLASHASVGAEVELAAPGVNIKNLWRGGQYASTSGTSAAAPHVAGVAASIWSLAPALSAQEVRDALTTSALDLGAPGRDLEYGHGLVQMYDALTTMFDRLPGHSLDDQVPIEVPEGSTLTWNVGNVALGARSFAWEFQIDEAYATADGAVVDALAPDDGDHAVILQYLDDGVLREKTRSFTVTNVAPTITSVSGPTDAAPGVPVVLALVATDPSDVLSYRYDWGDGTVEETNNASATNTYAAAGAFTIVISVDDGDGGVATHTHPMRIGDDLRFVPGSLVVEARPFFGLTNLGSLMDHPTQHTVRGVLEIEAGTALSDIPVELWVHRNGDRQLFDTIYVGATDAGITRVAFDTVLDMTAAWPTGTYTVDAIVDPQRQFVERVETNNLARTTFAHPRA